MPSALSTSPNRKKSLIILMICGLLVIAAVVVGIDDNLSGILLAFLAATALKKRVAKIFYNQPVKKILVKNNKAYGLELKSGKKIKADKIIINADFAYAINNLFNKSTLTKYSPERVVKKDYSCSIFMLYLGMNKQYKLQHNTIVMAKDYKKNIEDIAAGRIKEKDISFYVRDHSSTDPSMAASGKTALYILVPVANLIKGKNIDWEDKKTIIREWVLEGLENRLGLKDIRSHIEVERIITPYNWRDDYNVFAGAVFNLSHKLSQMLWLRPHNKCEEIDNCYLVGGGTHPGSGIPTILHSGRIAGLFPGRGR